LQCRAFDTPSRRSITRCLACDILVRACLGQSRPRGSSRGDPEALRSHGRRVRPVCGGDRCAPANFSRQHAAFYSRTSNMFALFAKWPQPETAPTAPRRSDSRWTIQRLIRSTLQRQGLNLSPRGPGCYWLLRGGRRGRRCGRWRGYVEGQHPNPGLTLTNINRSPIALELYRTTALALKGRTLFSLPSGLSQRRPSPRWSASRGPPFTALSRQGGYAHILKGYFSFSAVLCG